MLPIFRIKEIYHDLPQLEYKRVVITLYTSLLCIFLCVSLSIYFLVQSIYPLNVIFPGAILFYFVSVILLVKKKLKESKLLLYFSVLLQVLAMSYSLRGLVNMKIFYMPIAIIPFLIFGKRERNAFNISIAATVLNILIIYTFDIFQITSNVANSITENEFITKLFNFIALSCMIWLAYMFLSLTELGEELLLQNKSVLESQRQELAFKNESLVKSKIELEKLNGLKDKLLTIISHDLKSPLNNIDSFTELMLDDKLEKEDIAILLHKFKETSLNTRHLLDNLVKWSGNHILDPNPVQRQVSVNDLINHSMQNVIYFARQKNMHINNSIEESHIIWADFQMMEIIFRNLILNAIKFSIAGSEIKIYSNELNGRVQINVEDYGIGIPELMLPHLFSPGNFQARPGTAMEKGSGIGLLLCKQLVEANEGTISAQCIQNQKTIFTVDLPSGSTVKQSQLVNPL